MKRGAWVFLLFEVGRIAEGFRGAIGPIQPVFSLLSASSNDDKQSSRQRQQQPTFVNFSGGTLEFSWHASISDIPARVWDSCLPGSSKKNHTTGTSPFLEHSWLQCLEESGCASEETGWIPNHLSIHIHAKKYDGKKKKTKTSAGVKSKKTVVMDGCVPAYIKTHSMGEFIFDDSWADAAIRNGLDYYPKLLIGVPFTPVSGPRFLWHSQVWDTFSSQEEMDELNRAVGTFLKQSATTRAWSSVHINFCTDQEARALAGLLKGKEDASKDADDSSVDATNGERDGVDCDAPEEDEGGSIRQRLQAMLFRQLKQNDTNTYLRRTSLQYQWKNKSPQRGGLPFQDFDEYLDCFKSKRRITIRRERAKAKQDGTIRIDAIAGADILKVDGLVEKMFEIYVSTVDKMFWGRQYLTLEFFQQLCQTSFVHNLCFLCVHSQNYDPKDPERKARNGKSQMPKAEDIFAGTLNVVKDGVFYGRYWGCLPGHEVKNLHFETCYWSAIEYCIKNGLKRMEPGAGGADYKWARGFDPHLVHSIHYLCNPLLRQAVFQFVESETDYNVALRKHLLGKSALSVRETQKG